MLLLRIVAAGFRFLCISLGHLHGGKRLANQVVHPADQAQDRANQNAPGAAIVTPVDPQSDQREHDHGRGKLDPYTGVPEPALAAAFLFRHREAQWVAATSCQTDTKSATKYGATHAPLPARVEPGPPQGGSSLATSPKRFKGHSQAISTSSPIGTSHRRGAEQHAELTPRRRATTVYRATVFHSNSDSNQGVYEA